MLGSFISKIFGNKSDKDIKRLQPQLIQINNLYKNKDASFRGFRHHSGAGSGHTGEALKMKAKAVEGTEIMDGLTNWEASQTEDDERFSQRNDANNGSKT